MVLHSIVKHGQVLPVIQLTPTERWVPKVMSSSTITPCTAVKQVPAIDMHLVRYAHVPRNTIIVSVRARL